MNYAEQTLQSTLDALTAPDTPSSFVEGLCELGALRPRDLRSYLKLVLRHGREWSPLPKPNWPWAPRTAATRNHCFENSTYLATRVARPGFDVVEPFSYPELWYVEGIMIEPENDRPWYTAAVLDRHAWCVDAKGVIWDENYPDAAASAVLRSRIRHQVALEDGTRLQKVWRRIRTPCPRNARSAKGGPLTANVAATRSWPTCSKLLN